MPSIDVNGTSLHYRFDGPEDGTVVLLSNSLASNHTMWDLQVPALTGAGYRVLRYDSRGHGQSAAPQGAYTMETLCEDARALLDALGLDQVHFCGLSKGGMVGQMLATKHGDRLRTVTLCDTSSYMGPADTWQGRIDATSAGGMEAVVDATIDRWFTKPGQARIPEEVEKVRGMILGTPVQGFQGCCMAIRDMDQRESIKSISTPTLVIVGEDDPGTTVEMAQQIQASIAGARLVVLPEAAHLSNIEQPVGFNGALLGFLAQH